MSQAVLCPQCDKRYNLPENPPATFTCKQCGTPMDLSAFGGGEPPAPSGPQKGTGRRRRARGPSPQERREKRENKAPVFAIIVVVLIVVVLIAARSGSDEPNEPPPKPKKVAVVEPLEVPAPAPSAEEQWAAMKKRKTKRPPVRDDGSLKLRLGRIHLKPLDWPEEVSAETRQKVEESLALIYAGGADGADAREWLVGQGRPIAGRLISEFVSIKESPGWDNRDGTSMAMQIDAVLREIDGFMERTCREREQIRSTGVFAGQSFMTRIAKRWTWWWESGEWQTNPKKPWDPFDDESDDSATGMKPLESKKTDKKKGGGFGKRAGSG